MKKSHLLLIVLMLPFVSLSAKDIRLSYKLQKGQQFTLQINNRQNISMSMMGQSMTLNQQANLTQVVSVAEKTDDGYKLELKYDHIVFKQNAMGMELKYDSKNPDPNNPMTAQLAENFKKSLENTITAVINERGMPVSNNAKDVVGNTNLSGFESGLMVVYPDHSLKPGQSWDVQLKPDPASDFVINSTYKLESVKGNTAKISYSGTITGTEIMGASAKVNGTMSGNMEVNTTTGWLIKASINQNMEMEVEENGMKMPMSLSVFTDISTL
ncbi:MAG: hypothetical protein IPM52_03995 [Bacteroidetes bacterium]|nr:hypothetical protein [Bacteroidota bacterium]